MPNSKSTLLLRTAARRVGISLASAALLFVVAAIATARWGDRSLWPPSPGAPTTEVFIVSHGYHAGIVVDRAAMAEAAERNGDAALTAVTQRFADYRWLEIGWGDAGFYRNVPDAASLERDVAALAANPSAAPTRTASNIFFMADLLCSLRA